MGVWWDSPELGGSIYREEEEKASTAVIWVVGLDRVLLGTQFYASGARQPIKMFGPYKTLDQAKDTAEILYHAGLIE
jgi:hypothetical protein